MESEVRLCWWKRQGDGGCYVGGWDDVTGCPLRTQPGALVLLCDVHLKPSKTTRPGTLHGPLMITQPIVLIDSLTNPFLDIAKYNRPDLGAFIKALFTAFGGVSKEGPDQAGATGKRTGAHTPRHQQSWNIQKSVKEGTGPPLLSHLITHP